MRHKRGHTRRSLLFLAYAHHLAKDAALLKEAASRLWILSRATDYGEDSFNRGAFGGGTQAAGNSLFRGALATLGQMELAPNVEAECPRGLMIDGGPAGEGTGAKTGRYVRVAYVLEQRDGPIDLDVELAGGHQWGMQVDLRVLDPSGKEVARKQMAPRVDREERTGVPSGSGHYTFVTRWRVTVPADGVNGTYALRLVGQQKKGSWHNGLTLRITSSTGKLVWYIPQSGFAIRGSGGGLFIRPRADARHRRFPRVAGA